MGSNWDEDLEGDGEGDEEAELAVELGDGGDRAAVIVGENRPQDGKQRRYRQEYGERIHG